jgi:cell division transport system permease protein
MTLLNNFFQTNKGTPIVPAGSISGRALVVIIAIMTFLAGLTIAGVDLVRSSAADWQSAVQREATVQVLPKEGREIEKDVQDTLGVLSRFSDRIEVQAYSREESARLLEPWLGSGKSLIELPIPRLILLRQKGGDSDLTAISAALQAAVPTALLDDHRIWFQRLRTMSRTVVALGLAIVALMALTAALSAVFATRAAMATNSQVVEVLHFVGAPDAFIASEFARHFLWLGFKGGITGGLAAFLALSFLSSVASFLRATPAGDQLEAMFGVFSVSLLGLTGIVLFVFVIAMMTAYTSRITVFRVLHNID